MNAIKQAAIEGYNQAIAKLQKCRDAVDLLPDALAEIPGADLYSSSDYLRIDLPYTATAFKDARRLLGKDWKREGYEWTDKIDGDRIFSLYHKATRIRLMLVLRANVQGATCERRQVGVKEVPVYEVVCNG